MKRDELERLLGIAEGAAREAASLVMEGHRKPCDVQHKGAVDLVTCFDTDSEQLVRERLAGIVVRGPDGGAQPVTVVGEEGGGAWHAADVAFLVDPLDGTTNFVHGHPFFCVSIGVLERDLPVLGVVVAPALGLEWIGFVTEDGERHAERRSAGSAYAAATVEACAVSATARFEDALLATGFPYDRRTSPDNNFDAFVSIKRKCQAVRRCGSAALDLCLVADGTYEGYWEKKLRPWDIAAGAAIVRGAGGRVTDYGAGRGFMRSGHVVASNGAIHDALLAELARLPAVPGSGAAGPL